MTAPIIPITQENHHHADNRLHRSASVVSIDSRRTRSDWAGPERRVGCRRESDRAMQAILQEARDLVEFERRRQVSRETAAVRCRGCGCTNDRGCWDPASGTTCRWIEYNVNTGIGLCSACDRGGIA
ncbi:MAG: hypothetical protein U5P41_07380 [Gammaproteobacteria bacterium]|nr:hypothetical protein [Gammaproteobacteria bacterium]